jgi:hypothetical protein
MRNGGKWEDWMLEGDGIWCSKGAFMKAGCRMAIGCLQQYSEGDGEKCMAEERI